MILADTSLATSPLAGIDVRPVQAAPLADTLILAAASTSVEAQPYTGLMPKRKTTLPAISRSMRVSGATLMSILNDPEQKL